MPVLPSPAVSASLVIYGMVWDLWVVLVLDCVASIPRAAPWCLDWSTLVPALRTEYRSGLQKDYSCHAALSWWNELNNLPFKKRIFWEVEEYPYLCKFLHSVNIYYGPAMHRLQSWIPGFSGQVEKILTLWSSQSFSPRDGTSWSSPGLGQEAVPEFLTLALLLASLVSLSKVDSLFSEPQFPHL